jgi:L-asparagine transporter-like permease
MVKKEKQFWPIEGVTRSEVIKSQNDTRFNFLRTRKSRRAIISGLSLLTILVALSSVLPEKASSYVGTLGGLFLLIGYLLIRTSVRHIADSPDELLDERQIALRDRSYLHSYRIISSVFAVLLIGLFIRIDLSEEAFKISDWWGTGTWFSLIMLMAGLPSAVVAWLDKGEDEI